MISTLIVIAMAEKIDLMVTLFKSISAICVIRDF